MNLWIRNADPRSKLKVMGFSFLTLCPLHIYLDQTLNSVIQSSEGQLLGHVAQGSTTLTQSFCGGRFSCPSGCFLILWISRWQIQYPRHFLKSSWETLYLLKSEGEKTCHSICEQSYKVSGYHSWLLNRRLYIRFQTTKLSIWRLACLNADVPISTLSALIFTYAHSILYGHCLEMLKIWSANQNIALAEPTTRVKSYLTLPVKR